MVAKSDHASTTSKHKSARVSIEANRIQGDFLLADALLAFLLLLIHRSNTKQQESAHRHQVH